MDANKEQKLKVGSQAGPEQTQILQRLGDKEFWYWGTL
jgi:hypothetical protein